VGSDGGGGEGESGVAVGVDSDTVGGDKEIVGFSVVGPIVGIDIDSHIEGDVEDPIDIDINGLVGELQIGSRVL
jgi:hypothetical protein